MAGRQKGNFRRRRSDVMRWTPPAPIVGLPVFSLEAPRRPTSRSRTRVANGSKTERQSSAAMLRSELDARGADFGLPTFSLETHRHPTLQGMRVFPPAALRLLAMGVALSLARFAVCQHQSERGIAHAPATVNYQIAETSTLVSVVTSRARVFMTIALHRCARLRTC